MSANNTSSFAAEPERIDIHDPTSIDYWGREFKCTRKELEDSIAARGNRVVEVRNHLAQKRKSKSYTKWVFYSIGITGVFLLVMSPIIDNTLSHEANSASSAGASPWHIIAELCRDFGIAFLTAIVVARAFDIIYHRQMFIEPLNNTYTKVQQSYESIEHTNDQLKEQNIALKQQLINFNSILKTAQEEGIVAIYRRDEANLKADIELAIANADRYLYIQGQTFKRLLVQGVGREQFGINAVGNRLRDQPDLRVRICLSNTFDKNSHARLGLTKEEEGGSRESVLDIFEALSKLAKHIEYNICLRLTAENPMYGILLTEDCLFLEHYTPNSSDSTILVFKSLSNKSLHRATNHFSSNRKLHETYMSIFEEAYGASDAKICSVVLDEYLLRKQVDPTHKISERDRKFIERVKQNLPVAQRVDNREGHFTEVV